MYRILELLRRQEGFLSGEDIGRELSITRAAVWKGIKKLREEGYEIEAVTNRGYRQQTRTGTGTENENHGTVHLFL